MIGPLLGRQLAAVMRLEWQRQLRSWRPLLLLALALLPVAIMAIVVFVHAKLAPGESLADQRVSYANLYHGLVLRVVLFFGSLVVFLGLVRGEVEGRSFHYHLLSPVPRPVLVVGKYAAALLLAWGLFVPATLVSHGLLFAGELGALVAGPALAEGATYGTMTAVACLAYGALFLAVGTLVRSPGFLVAFLFTWEWFQFLLPPFLKHLSVAHYVKALTPVPLDEGPFALLAEPKPPLLAVAQLALYAALFVALSAWSVRRMELDYGK